MSYILDALRRAQAERGRGSVPGLHTPATPVTGLPVASGSTSRGLAWSLAALAAAVVLAAGGWWLWRTPPAPPVAVAPSAAPSAAPSVAPNLAVVTAPAPAATVASAAVTAEAVPAPVPTLAPAPAPQRVEKRTPPPAARPERAAATPAPAAQAPKPAPARPTPSTSEAPVFAQADLPPAVREQLPTLQLAGVTYSTNPLYRMVIVNGQVLHEGDQAAPGLVLERIEPGRTVWAFRGYRYALPAQ